MTRINQSQKTGIVHYASDILGHSLSDYEKHRHLREEFRQKLSNISQSVSTAAKLAAPTITCYYLTATSKQYKKPGVQVSMFISSLSANDPDTVSYTHLRAHETPEHL